MGMDCLKDLDKHFVAVNTSKKGQMEAVTSKYMVIKGVSGNS